MRERTRVVNALLKQDRDNIGITRLEPFEGMAKYGRTKDGSTVISMAAVERSLRLGVRWLVNDSPSNAEPYAFQSEAHLETVVSKSQQHLDNIRRRFARGYVSLKKASSYFENAELLPLSRSVVGDISDPRDVKAVVSYFCLNSEISVYGVIVCGQHAMSLHRTKLTDASAACFVVLNTLPDEDENGGK